MSVFVAVCFLLLDALPLLLLLLLLLASTAPVAVTVGAREELLELLTAALELLLGSSVGAAGRVCVLAETVVYHGIHMYLGTH